MLLTGEAEVSYDDAKRQEFWNDEMKIYYPLGSNDPDYALANRIEKGKEACANSPTLDEERAQKVLGEKICVNGVYNEDIVRNRVDRILVFCENLEIRCKDESKFSANLYKIK